MSSLEPISIALKYGFLVVLYLFLLWVARSAIKDLRRGASGRPGGVGGAHAPAVGARTGGQGVVREDEPPPDATGMYAAASLSPLALAARSPRLVVERAPGHEEGMIYDLDEDVTLGRGGEADIRLEDPFASAGHARIFEQGGILVLEDLGSTNGTYLNEELLDSPRPLHPGDRVRIGDSQFSFEVD